MKSNLINILTEAEKEFDEIFPEKSDIKLDRKKLREAYKSHNRVTILKLVEEIEKWVDSKRTQTNQHGMTSAQEIEDFIKDLKNKLKDF